MDNNRKKNVITLLLQKKRDWRSSKLGTAQRPKT